MKCTFWNFDLSRSEHEASRFRTEPHIVKSTDGNLFRNPGCIKTVLYSKLHSLLIENIIMLTLVENRRREVQGVKYVIQRRAEQISTVPRTCTRRKIAISFRYYFTVKTKKKILNIMHVVVFLRSFLSRDFKALKGTRHSPKKKKKNKQGDQIPRQMQIATNPGPI